jgi:hypothetical protein
MKQWVSKTVVSENGKLPLAKRLPRPAKMKVEEHRHFAEVIE